MTAVGLPACLVPAPCILPGSLLPLSPSLLLRCFLHWLHFLKLLLPSGERPIQPLLYLASLRLSPLKKLLIFLTYFLSFLSFTIRMEAEVLWGIFGCVLHCSVLSTSNRALQIVGTTNIYWINGQINELAFIECLLCARHHPKNIVILSN